MKIVKVYRGIQKYAEFICIEMHFTPKFMFKEIENEAFRLLSAIRALCI